MKVEAGPLLFISGTTARDADNRLVGGQDVSAQTRQVFENLKAILEHEGATLKDLVRVTVYLTDMKLFGEVARVREEIFHSDGPASTLVGVSSLARPGALIEVDAVAALPRSEP